ncbi:hypothetical protein L1D51_19755 [Pseudoalteromonas shioyasakiensis]|uniref:hypothetical protein n=1 Tax=Pseudoalteromonas shioyasakiensis TaxID=1190813 RepID=UPI001EFE9196|nr:hypothetical protein [Pseudoalteromonas shioyasakiensis]MCG9736200.1 hypothetical protein [Pseudoalteromonas shioyasakiensis]
MARPLPLEFAGALYHVTSRGNDRRPIYLDEAKFDGFLKVSGDVFERHNWVTLSIFLMSYYAILK